MKLIPTEPKKRNALFIGILALLGLYAFQSYWYAPRKETMQEMEARLEQLTDQNRRAQILATRGGRELEERLALYERHLLRLEQLIPRSEEVPALLNSMSIEARQNDVDLALMRPDPQPETTEHYTKTVYQIGVTGNYHSVGRFLAAIASLPRILTPIDLDVATASAAQQRGADENADTPIQATFKIQTYTIPPPGALPAPGTGEGVAAGGGA
ncbi:MAG: type 4a pilus biogenesis protein PilO [Gemmatimonadota bacterium]